MIETIYYQVIEGDHASVTISLNTDSVVDKLLSVTYVSELLDEMRKKLIYRAYEMEHKDKFEKEQCEKELRVFLDRVK
jgi:hypothetical protein